MIECMRRVGLVVLIVVALVVAFTGGAMWAIDDSVLPPADLGYSDQEVRQVP